MSKTIFAKIIDKEIPAKIVHGLIAQLAGVMPVMFDHAVATGRH